LELKARIKAILRRSAKTAEKTVKNKQQLSLRDIALEPQSRRVFVKNKEINLTAKEFDLLEFFIRNIGKVYEREQLLSEIWGHDNTGDVRTVDVHVRRLREKIEENPSDPKYIFTKWGVGYYFR
jgi:DNA-binding response OmpR family regulator